MSAEEVPAASAGASRPPAAASDDGMSGGMISASGAAAGAGGACPSPAAHVISSIANEPLSPISTATSNVAGDPPAPAPTLATGAHELEWTDKNLGRPAALAANGVLGAAAGTTKMVGWTVGDSNLHVRSGFRSLAAMHLRVSARVHHVAFYHPSLDAEIAAPSSSSSFGGGGGLSSSSHHGSSGGKRVLDGVRHAIGLEGRGGSMDWSAEEAARLAAVVESESFRLSRDGIVEQHFARRRSSNGRPAKSSSPSRNRKATSSPDRTPRARPAAAAAGTSANAVAAEEGRGAMATPRKDTRRANSAVAGDSEHGRDEIPTESDAGATSSSSIKPRKFVVASRIPQSAENRRTSAGDTPEANLRQMLKKGKKGRSKERDAMALAASVAATASAEGKINRGATSTIAKQRSTVSNEGDSIGKLLEEHAAPVAFDPDNITGDGAALAGMIKKTASARIGRYLPEVACRVPSSSVCFHLKGDKRHVQSTQPFVVEAPHVVFGGGRDRLIRRVAADGNPLVDARRFEYLSNKELSMSQRTESLLCAGATVWVDVARPPKKDTKTAVDVAKNIGNAATKTAHDTNKGVKKIFKFATPKRPKKKKSSAAEDIQDDASNPSEKPSLDVSSAADGVGEVSAGAIDDALPLGDISSQASPAGVIEENVGSASISSSRLPDAPRPYVLVLDDVLEFRVQEFPSNSTIASFPISVASILNNTDMEERLNNPRRPSELTVTLVQEPSIKEKKWGCEVKITFRCAEVRPDSPLAMEKPEQDDKGRWTKSSLDDRMKRMRVHLKNVGKPKERIEEEIRAMEEKELEEEEEREAAIIMAGIGKGYEQGAPAREIVKRQMFYDPEREEFRRKPRAFNSNDLNSGVIREVALTSSNIPGSKKSTKKNSSKQRRMSPIPDSPDIPTEIISFDNNERQQAEFPLVNVSNMSTDEPTEGQMKSTRNEAVFKSCVERENNEEEASPPFSIQAMRSQYGSARDLLLPEIEHISNVPSKAIPSEVEQKEGIGEENEVFVTAQTGSSNATGASSLRKLERKKNNVSVVFKSMIEEPSPTAAAESYETTSVNIPGQSKEVSFSKPSENDIFLSSVHGPTTISESESSVVDRKQSRNESIDSFFSEDTGTGDDSDADAFSPRSAATAESATFSLSRGAAIAREKEEERVARRRDRKRLSMQSMALMHLSLGGAAQQKNLLGDEMDLLCQIAIEEEEDELGGSKSSIAHRSTGTVSISSPEKKQQQQQKTGTSRIKAHGTSIRDKGKRVLLEEYPGLMILLFVILSVVSVKVIFRLLL